MLCRATQDGEFMVESSDKTWSTEKGNVKQFWYSCLANPCNSMKRQSNMTLKDELPRSVGIQYAAREEQKIAPEGTKSLSQSRKNTHLWLCLVVKVCCCKEQ